MSGNNALVRFDGNNFSTWEFQFRMYVKGKALLGHLDGTTVAPTDPKNLLQWASNDAKVISWILGSIETHMLNDLRSCSTAKDMWDYLKRIYYQDNSARRIQLELELASYTQGTLSVGQYYSTFLTMWNEYSGIVTAKVPQEALEAIRIAHATSQRDQFLMKLRPEFETVRGSLLNRDPVPSLEICLRELLREEQRLNTLQGMMTDTSIHEASSVAYAAQRRKKDTSGACFSCNEVGHIARNCPKRSCNYCEQPGHLIRLMGRFKNLFQKRIPHHSEKFD